MPRGQARSKHVPEPTTTLADLRSRTDARELARLASSTVKSYRVAQLRFYTFLKSHFQEQLNVTSASEWQDYTATRFPVDAKLITEEMVCLFLEYERSRQLTPQSVSSSRAAVKDIWTQQSELYPAWLTAKNGRTKVAMQAHKRQHARLVDAGTLSPGDGMRCLEFGLFEKLMSVFMVSAPDPFAHCFSLLSWNLLCRSDNTERIRFNHITTVNDALIFRFYHTKSDQSDDRSSSEPKHVFANPLQPILCSFLSLALYLMQYSASGETLLFPGEAQSKRVLTAMRAGMEGQEISKLRNDRGWGLPENYGTHSYRKGATSYCFGGQAGSENVLSVILRGGWSIGGAKETYIHYQPSGDQYVGRLVAGLPPRRPEFAILPAFFPEKSFDSSEFREFVAVARSMMFPAFCESGMHGLSIPILNLLVAQVVYHKDWLRSNLPRSHMFFRNPLFFSGSSRYSSIVKVLDENLWGGTRTSIQESVYKASGMPVATQLLTMLVELRETRWDSVNEMKEFMSNKLDSFILPDASVSNFTLDKKLKEFGDEIRSFILEHVPRDQLSPQDGARSSMHGGAGSVHGFGNQMYLYGGRFHRVPETFSLPACSLREAFRIWFCGTDMVCRFSLLKCAEMPNVQTRRRFSEWRVVMQALCKKLKDAGESLDDVDAIRANILYEKLVELKAVPSSVETQGNKRLRGCDRSIYTVYKRLRLENKPNSKASRAVVPE